LLNAHGDSWWMWLRLACWTWWPLHAGPPFKPGDWLVFVRAVGGLLLPLCVAAPALLYERIVQTESGAHFSHPDLASQPYRRSRRTAGRSSRPEKIVIIDARVRHADGLVHCSEVNIHSHSGSPGKTFELIDIGGTDTIPTSSTTMHEPSATARLRRHGADRALHASSQWPREA